MSGRIYHCEKCGKDLFERQVFSVVMFQVGEKPITDRHTKYICFDCNFDLKRWLHLNNDKPTKVGEGLDKTYPGGIF